VISFGVLKSEYEGDEVVGPLLYKEIRDLGKSVLSKRSESEREDLVGQFVLELVENPKKLRYFFEDAPSRKDDFDIKDLRGLLAKSLKNFVSRQSPKNQQTNLRNRVTKLLDEDPRLVHSGRGQHRSWRLSGHGPVAEGPDRLQAKVMLLQFWAQQPVRFDRQVVERNNPLYDLQQLGNLVDLLVEWLGDFTIEDVEDVLQNYLTLSAKSSPNKVKGELMGFDSERSALRNAEPDDWILGRSVTRDFLTTLDDGEIVLLALRHSDLTDQEIGAHLSMARTNVLNRRSQLLGKWNSHCNHLSDEAKAVALSHLSELLASRETV
jgi:hypothetical protein